MGIAGEDVSVTVSGGIPPLPRMRTDEHGRRVAVYPLLKMTYRKPRWASANTGGMCLLTAVAKITDRIAMMVYRPIIGGGISTLRTRTAIANGCIS